MNRQEILELVEKERDRQDVLHPNDYLFGRLAPSILGEEVGEVHKAWLEQNEENLKEELVQVAAVAVRWLENMNND